MEKSPTGGKRAAPGDGDDRATDPELEEQYLLRAQGVRQEGTGMFAPHAAFSSAADACLSAAVASASTGEGSSHCSDPENAANGEEQQDAPPPICRVVAEDLPVPSSSPHRSMENVSESDRALAGNGSSQSCPFPLPASEEPTDVQPQCILGLERELRFLWQFLKRQAFQKMVVCDRQGCVPHSYCQLCVPNFPF